MVLLNANKKLMESCEELMYEAHKNQSAVEGLKGYIYEYLKFWTERKRELIFFSLSMTKAMTHREIFDMYEGFVEDYIDSFEKLFKKGIKTGEFKKHDSRGSSIALMSALDGLIVYMVLNKKLVLEDVTNHFEEVFIKPLIKE
jgi:hypothetical protein